MKKQRVTIASIAQELGLSIFTVSTALSGGERVAAATRERVESAAKRLGYRHSNVGRSLRSGRSMLIGVISDRSSWLLGERWEGDWLSGIHDAAKDAGYRLLLNLPKRGEDRTWRKGRISPHGVAEMTDGMVDGIIVLGGMALSKEDLGALDNSGIPLVFAANDFKVPGQSQYLSGLPEKFDGIARRLIELGHKKVGVAGIEGADSFNRCALDALKRAFKAKGLTFRPAWFKQLATDNRAGMMESWDAAWRSWSGKEAVTALLFSYGDQSRVLDESASRKGYDLHQAPFFAALGGHNNPPARLWQNGLLWDADIVQAGKETFALLLDRMQGGKPRYKTLSWSERSFSDYWRQGEKN